MGDVLGSQVAQAVPVVASGKFVMQASPVWAWQKGFAVLITRTAAGHYVVTPELEIKNLLIQVSLEGAQTAATPPSIWFTVNATTGVIDLFCDVNTAGTGALADSGTFHITVARVLDP